MGNQTYDFAGYATKNGIKCRDGRVIQHGAFSADNGKKVPLVWQHQHNTPENILGHAILEEREDGMYARCKFNSTKAGNAAREIVRHGDVVSLSIYANDVVQAKYIVTHGVIREISLVISGSNSGALIDDVVLHSDDTFDDLDGEMIMSFGEKIEFEESPKEIKHSSEEDETVQDVLDTFNEKQKNVFYAVIGNLIDSDSEASDEDVEHSDSGDLTVKKNVFDSTATSSEERNPQITREQFGVIMADALKGGSFRAAVLQHAGTYGIDNIEYLFPEARNVTQTPTFIKRQTSWVAKVLGGVRKSPFSRIRSIHADITGDEARALGYIKGNLKKEEVFGLLRRSTTPTTVYKKQKLDRDDIVDITDFDVVAWMRTEMRWMLDEELARSLLISDGRASDSTDKIAEANIRPIYKDADLYVYRVTLPVDSTVEDFMDSVITYREFYKGSGNPSLYMTTGLLTQMLLLKDTTGHRIYKTKAEVESALLVSEIVEVPVMSGVSRESGDDTLNLKAILVNLDDYTMGADKGGQVNSFDDFDIDYNQQKYLIETRCSGALTVPYSAQVFEQVAE